MCNVFWDQSHYNHSVPKKWCARQLPIKLNRKRHMTFSRPLQKFSSRFLLRFLFYFSDLPYSHCSYCCSDNYGFLGHFSRRIAIGNQSLAPSLSPVVRCFFSVKGCVRSVQGCVRSVHGCFPLTLWCALEVLPCFFPSTVWHIQFNCHDQFFRTTKD